jgi:hypothetical protein
VRFCLKRPEKAVHCRELQITHFIDDRTDVLEAMLGVVPNLYLFGPQADRPPGMVHVPGWKAVAEELLTRTQRHTSHYGYEEGETAGGDW